MILATAGHIDHGKTALVRALTGVDADRLPEEKRRGLTIDLGFAYTTLPDGTELGFVDVPGHERFLPNMLAGVLSIDRVLLIVAADDGPRPQTLEHLDVIELIGISEVTGVVTKIDRVDDERRQAVAAELAGLFERSGHRGSPILAVSSRTGEGIAALADHLRERAAASDAERAAQPPQGQFRLPIDRVFSLPGIGMVVTGTAASGEVAPGDRLLVSPRGIEVRVRGVHAHNRPVERVRSGDRCALNLAGSFPDGAEPGRGDWVLAPALHAPTGRIDVALSVSRAAPAPLKAGLPVHLHLGTEDRVARVGMLGQRMLAAGEEGFVQLDLDRPIGALWGDRIVLRDHGAIHTLAGGRVIDPFTPRRGRARPERLALLPALREEDAGSALEGLLGAAGIVDLAPFALARNLSLDTARDLVDAGGFLRIGDPRAPYAATRERLADLGERIAALLGDIHRAEPDALGAPRPAVIRRLRGAAPEPVLDAALATAIGAGQVIRDGAVQVAPAGASAAAQPRGRAPVAAGRTAARRAGEPASTPRVREPGRGARPRSRAGAAPDEALRALRPGRAGRAEPLFPARDPHAPRRGGARAGRGRPRRGLYRGRVQGPLGGWPQPDNRNPRIPRPHRRHPPLRRRPGGAARRRDRPRLRRGPTIRLIARPISRMKIARQH